MLRLHISPAKQLEKAKRLFQMNSKLFHSYLLKKEAKLICYQLLIRPVITYAALIWFNISVSSMEHIRIFERACLRVFLKKFRTPQSGYEKHYSNKHLYNKIDFPRIDLFIIKLIKGYFANMCYIKYHDLLSNLQISEAEVRKQCSNGNVTPTYVS